MSARRFGILKRIRHYCNKASAPSLGPVRTNVTRAVGLAVVAAEPEVFVGGVSGPDREDGRVAASELPAPGMRSEPQSVAAGRETESVRMAVPDLLPSDDPSSGFEHRDEAAALADRPPRAASEPDMS
jgi:hypothetical protein